MTQTQQVAKAQPQSVAKPIDRLKSMLNSDSIKEQFTNALGDSRKEFVASLIDLYTGDKQLQSCQPAEIVCQALKAAVLKLPLVKAMGQAYIVVYKNKGVPTPTFIIGYKGLIQLAKRSGLYVSMNAGTIYEGELMGIDKLTGDLDISGEKKSDKVVGYFAYFRETNGFSHGYYMSVEDMVRYAKTYSASCYNVSEEQLMQAAQSHKMTKTVGWLGNFQTMAEKTCLRQLISKWGSLSVEMQKAIINDDAADAETERNTEVDEATTVEYVELDAQDAAQPKKPESEQQAQDEESQNDPY